MKNINITVFVSLLVISASSAGASMVNVFDSHYSYELKESASFIYPESGDYFSQTLTSSGTSSTPVSESIAVVDNMAYAKAYADLFYVYAESTSREWSPEWPYGDVSAGGYATVVGSWTFQPTDNISGLIVDFLDYPEWSTSFFSLVDETLNAEIHSGVYEQGYFGEYYVPSIISDWHTPPFNYLEPDPENGWLPESLNIDHLLLENHVYSITIGTYSESSNDGRMSFGLKVRNIQAVPEPDTIILLGVGLLGLAVASRKRFKAHTTNFIIGGGVS